MATSDTDSTSSPQSPTGATSTPQATSQAGMARSAAQSKTATQRRMAAAVAFGGLMALGAVGIVHGTPSDTNSANSTNHSNTMSPPPAASSKAAKAGGQADAALVERGYRVSIEADCAACHTAPGNKPYAGGAALKSPFGDLYPPNVTPDRETGIGTWTETDFEGSMRRGVSKNGKALYPAMPYDHYTLMSDADISALWAYMKTIEPVKQKAPPNTLPFPLNVRTGMTVWQAAFFKPGRFQPDPAKSAEWNRGAYLVEGPGHCGACHTPRNLAQASMTDKQLSGAKIEGWYAPNISGDPSSKLADYTVDSLKLFLQTGRSPNNGVVVGSMKEVVHSSMSRLPDADVRAIAVYLKDQPPNRKPEAWVREKVDPERIAAGQAVYEQHCSNCHGADGKGIAGGVPGLAKNNSVTASRPYTVISAMLEGFEPNGSYGAMASFASTLTDQQIADVTNYVRQAWGNEPGQAASAWAVSRLRSLAEPSDEVNQTAMLCPALPEATLKPALDAGEATLNRAARDPAVLQRLVNDYRSKLPKASSSQVVEALSTAYCRSVVGDDAKRPNASAKIANFSQQVAALVSKDSGPRGASMTPTKAPTTAPTMTPATATP